MPAQKHDNQYTMPALTETEILDRFRQVCSLRKFNRVKDGRDWLALFVEWVRTEPSQFANVGLWARTKGIHPVSLQGHGGRTFWNQARQSVRQTALSRAIEKTPEIIEKRFDKYIEASLKAKDLALKMIANLDRLASSDKKEDFEAKEGRLLTLAETLSLLAETYMKLANEGVERHEVKSLNLHATIVESLRERNQRLGVVG